MPSSLFPFAQSTSHHHLGQFDMKLIMCLFFFMSKKQQPVKKGEHKIVAAYVDSKTHKAIADISKKTNTTKRRVVNAVLRHGLDWAKAQKEFA